MFEFWKAAGFRAIHTAAQTALGSIGAAQILQEVSWAFVGSTIALATIVSLLKSIILGTPEGGHLKKEVK